MKNQNIHHDALPRLTAITAASAVLLSGCSLDSQPVPDESNVVFVGSNHPSPTDEMANRIWKSIQFRNNSTDGEKSADKDVATDEVIGAKRFTGGMQDPYSNLYTLMPGEYASLNEALPKKKFNAALKSMGINEPQAVEKIKKAYGFQLAAAALNEVEYGEAEPSVAKIINSYSPEAFKKIQPVLDRLDLNDAVGRNLLQTKKDRADFLADMADIKTPEVRELAMQAAGGSYTAVFGVLKSSQATRKKAEKMAGSLTAAASEALEDLPQTYGEEAQERDIRIAIARHNDIKAEQVKRIASERQAGKQIDLTGVKGTKIRVDRYYSSRQSDPVVQHQFGEIYAEGGELHLQFNSDSNIKPAAAAQLRKGFERVRPLLEAAFANGDILSVRFLATDSFNGHFDSQSNEIGLELPADAQMSESQFEMLVAHEAVHALVSSAFDEESYASTGEILNVKKACTALSQSAFDNFTAANSWIGYSAESVAKAMPEGVDKQAMLELAKLIRVNGLDNLMNKKEYSTDSAFKKSLSLSDCADWSFGDVLATVYEKLGSKDGLGDLDRFNKEYVRNADVQALISEYKESMQYNSIFKEINESSFVDTVYKNKDMLGHSRDNAHEMMASIVDTSLLNIKAFKTLLGSLDTESKAAVMEAISAGYAIISNRHPSLKTYLSSVLRSYVAVS